MDFFKVTICPRFIEVYGQTEATGGEFFTYGYEKDSGTVGRAN